MSFKYSTRRKKAQDTIARTAAAASKYRTKVEAATGPVLGWRQQSGSGREGSGFEGGAAGAYTAGGGVNVSKALSTAEKANGDRVRVR